MEKDDRQKIITENKCNRHSLTHSLTLADKVTNRKTCAFKINNRRSALTSGLVESSLNLVS